MTERHLFIPLDAETYWWLQQVASDTGVGAGEMARRVIAWAREDPGEAPAPIDAETHRREVERQAMIAETRARASEEAARRSMLLDARARSAQILAEIEELEGGGAPKPPRSEQARRDIPPQPPAFFPSLTPKLPASGAERPSVLDMDLSNEPRADDVDIPADPGDIPAPAAAGATPRAIASMLDAAPGTTLPSGQRPGAATRPTAPNRDLASGLRTGDGRGNVVRSNFSHLGFSPGVI